MQLRADVVLDWTALALDCIRADNTSPTLSTRNLAMLHTAIYDAVNSITRTHQPYRFQLNAPTNTSPEAAAVGAAYEVTTALYPSFTAWAGDLYALWSASVPHNDAFTNGLELGGLIGLVVLNSRSTDGASTEVPYIPGSTAGQWQRTPPYFRPPLTPHWRYVDTFCLPDLEPFVPGPPPALGSAEYAVAFNEVKSIGGTSSAVRTPEQSQIAIFWSDFSYTAMPPGHWHEIAMTIARARGNTLAENARMFALLSLAQADSAIVCWESKYRYNLWRPVTAIQRADEDGNPGTDPDPAWDQFLPSPPFPSYTSGHSTFSKASAQVLTHFWGTDEIDFATTSDSLPGVVRSFHSLSACADEIGMSRIYGGFHFQFDNRAGKEAGQRIADFIFANFLLPNDRLPLARVGKLETSGISISVHAHLGRESVLEASTNLRDWTALATNIAVAGGFTVHDSAGLPIRFYRVRER